MDIQPLVQGGAVGLCALAIWVIYKMQNGQSKRFTDAINRNSDAWEKNAKALSKLSTQLTKKR